MPEYICTTEKNGTYSSKYGRFAPGERAILDEEYAKSKPKTWRLASEYDAEQEKKRESRITGDTDKDTIKKLKAQIKKLKKPKVDQDDKTYSPKLEYKDLLVQAEKDGFTGQASKANIEAFYKEKLGE